MLKDFDLFFNGGLLRDELLGFPSKDIDYTAVDRHPTDDWQDSFAKLGRHLAMEGFDVFKTDPGTFTIRAKFPKGHPLERQTADFVLARKEGPYTDRRHPDWVRPGNLMDDLARRDFTINAMARPIEGGDIIDPHDGQGDIERKVLRFVGNAEDRLMEDPLRAFRLLRFHITKGFDIDPDAIRAVLKLQIDDFVGVSTDMMRVELDKAFKHDTFATFEALGYQFYELAIFALKERGLRLIPSFKER